MSKWTVHLEFEHEASGDLLRREFPWRMQWSAVRKLMAERRGVNKSQVQLSYRGTALKDTDNMQDTGLRPACWYTIKVIVVPPPAAAAAAAAAAVEPTPTPVVLGGIVPVREQIISQVLAEARQEMDQRQVVIRASLNAIQERLTALQASNVSIQRWHDELTARQDARVVELEAQVADLSEQLHAEKHRSKPSRSDREDAAALARQAPRKNKRT